VNSLSCRAEAAAVLVVTSVLLPGVGCDLFSRGKALDVRWFTPERIHSEGIANAQGVTSAPGGAAEGQPGREASSGPCELRLASVTSAADLGPRIHFGDGLYRVEQYEGLRWTERPEHYVRRALGRTLFEQGTFRRSVSGGAPTLDVELLDFEEVKTPAQHAARIVVRVVVASDHVLAERTLVVTEPVVGGSVDDFVGTMAAVLDKAAAEVALVAQIGCPA
jgi:hypothetical protein